MNGDRVRVVKAPRLWSEADSSDWFLRNSLVGAMAWSLVCYNSGGDSVGEIANQIVNLFRAVPGVLNSRLLRSRFER